MTDADEHPPPARADRLEGKDVLQMLAASMALFCGALYLIQHLAIEDFYAQFDGLTPELVGTDQTVLLTRVGVWGLILSWLFLLIAGGATAMLRVAAWSTVEPLTLGSRTKQLAARAITPTMLGLWFGLCSMIPGRPPGPAIFWFVVAAATLFAAGVLWAAQHAPMRYRRGITALVIALSILGPAGIWADAVMAERGQRLALTGHIGRVEGMLGVRIQYVRAEFSRATGQPERADGPYLYLGESAGLVALYDCKQHTVQRVAAPQIQLTTALDGSIARQVITSCRQGR